MLSSPRLRVSATALLVLAIVGATALGAITADTASAAVTTSAVTSPAPGTIVDYDYDLDHPIGQPVVNAPANQLTISGTSSGTTGDTVDIGCQSVDVATPTWRALANDVAVESNGSFTVAVSKKMFFADQPCTIRAIPGATADAARATLPVASFGGPLTTPSYIQTYRTSPEGRLRDFYLARTQAEGYFDYDSAASCGLDYSRVITGTVASDHLFDCNDYFYKDYNASRNGVQVDGARAYLPDDVDNTTKGGAPVLTFTRAVDPTSGDLTVVERDDVVRCHLPADPGAADQCPYYEPTGLRLERTITQSSAGRQTTLADQWISTDGAAHRLDVIAEEDFATGPPAYKASWEDPAYVQRDSGDIVGAPPAGAAATMYVDGNTLQPDSGAAYPQGAITYVSGPSAFSFGNNDFYYVRYLKTVPAGGATSIVQVYSQATSQPEVQGLAAAAAARYAPAPAPVPAPAPNVVVPPAQCVVPALKGLTVKKAKAALSAAKCAPGRTTKKTTTKKSKVGKVLRASKKPGTAGALGSKIDLVVGKAAKGK